MTCSVAVTASESDLVNSLALCRCDMVTCRWCHGHTWWCRGIVRGDGRCVGRRPCWWPWRRWWSAGWRGKSAARSWRHRWVRGWSRRSTASCAGSASRCQIADCRPSTPTSDFSTRRYWTASCGSCRRPVRPSAGTESGLLCITGQSVRSRRLRHLDTTTPPHVDTVVLIWLHLSSTSVKTVSIWTSTSRSKVRCKTSSVLRCSSLVVQGDHVTIIMNP